MRRIAALSLIPGAEMVKFCKDGPHAVDGTLRVYRKTLDEGPERYLRGRPVKPAFRR